MSDMLNNAITTGPVSLPDAVAMLDTAYLGHVIVLWSWALKQPNPDAIESATVRFRSLDGRDREVAIASGGDPDDLGVHIAASRDAPDGGSGAGCRLTRATPAMSLRAPQRNLHRRLRIHSHPTAPPE
jgi:hypothetical protein